MPLQGTIYNDVGQITKHDSVEKYFDFGHGGNGYICLFLEVLFENK